MAQQIYRGNLTSAEIPFLSELQGRTVIVSGIDQNYSRQLSSAKNKDRDIGIPQIYYMHNVIPTDAGVCTVAYSQIAAAPINTPNTFIGVFLLRDPNENVAYLGICSDGQNYILTDPAIGWNKINSISPAAKQFITSAHVNGQTYICFGGFGTYKYNNTTKLLEKVTLTALDDTQILGICASSGYMIAWTFNSVKWSSTIDPTDFTPSTVTGAGGESIQEAKAAITCCLPQTGGFVIYTKRNAIGVSYTQNAQYPFNAREIIGAGGLAKPQLAGYDGNSTNHMAYTTAGLQEISISSSNIAFPQVTDFLAGSQFEDFDENSLTFTVNTISGAMLKKITVVANRYLIISYGVTQLSHALFYDIALARWGKLKLPHVDCFEYAYPSSDVVDTPRKSIGFLNSDGTIRVVTLSYDTTGSNGVLICGKYQLARSRYVDLQSISVESIKTNNELKVKLFSTVDGKNNVRITDPYLMNAQGTLRDYSCRASGLNHSIMLAGAFHAHSLELKFSDAGSVR
jgi:hypothetical protein